MDSDPMHKSGGILPLTTNPFQKPILILLWNKKGDFCKKSPYNIRNIVQLFNHLITSFNKVG